MEGCWQECKLQEGSPREATYFFREDHLGLNGFYAHIPDLDLPLFLSGVANQYRHYCSSDQRFSVLWQIGFGVVLLEKATNAYVAVWGYFIECQPNLNSLVFGTEPLPVYGASPDRVLIDMRDQQLKFFRGSISGTYAEVTTNVEPLKIHRFR